jgi:hypothetical protein
LTVLNEAIRGLDGSRPVAGGGTLGRGSIRDPGERGLSCSGGFGVEEEPADDGVLGSGVGHPQGDVAGEVPDQVDAADEPREGAGVEHRLSAAAVVVVDGVEGHLVRRAVAEVDVDRLGAAGVPAGGDPAAARCSAWGSAVEAAQVYEAGAATPTKA